MSYLWSIVHVAHTVHRSSCRDYFRTGTRSSRASFVDNERKYDFSFYISTLQLSTTTSRPESESHLEVEAYGKIYTGMWASRYPLQSVQYRPTILQFDNFFVFAMYLQFRHDPQYCMHKNLTQSSPAWMVFKNWITENCSDHF